ncbi:MAG: TSUP family transporter, partial [Thiotrichaceae bacterium]|nr:TSUP family transporter [Thiotrichaceae bacterium]
MGNMELSYEIIGILFTVALLAGFVDSISGGGLLIILPALMLSGFLPAEALATNKLQAIFGKLSAVVYYRRQGMLNVPSMKLPLLASFIGAAIGALVIQHIQSEFLTKHIPWLIGAVAIYFLFSPRIGDLDKQQRIQIGAFALLVATSLGFYDGFFGPASGSLFALSFVSLLGYNLSKNCIHQVTVACYQFGIPDCFYLGGECCMASGTLHGHWSMGWCQVWLTGCNAKRKQ